MDDKSIVKDQSFEKPKEDKVHQPVEVELLLTQAALDLAMPQIKQHFQDAGRSMELAVLEQDIKLVGGQLVLEVMGQLQEDIVEKMKAELVRMLRELTKSTRFSIKVNVKEEIESNSKRLYTSTDKLNHLKTIHPALSDFQRRFGLETDF
jgi:hypothetical protein